MYQSQTVVADTATAIDLGPKGATGFTKVRLTQGGAPATVWLGYDTGITAADTGGFPWDGTSDLTLTVPDGTVVYGIAAAATTVPVNVLVAG